MAGTKFKAGDRVYYRAGNHRAVVIRPYDRDFPFEGEGRRFAYYIRWGDGVFDMQAVYEEAIELENLTPFMCEVMDYIDRELRSPT